MADLGAPWGLPGGWVIVEDILLDSLNAVLYPGRARRSTKNHEFNVTTMDNVSSFF